MGSICEGAKTGTGGEAHVERWVHKTPLREAGGSTYVCDESAIRKLKDDLNNVSLSKVCASHV